MNPWVVLVCCLAGGVTGIGVGGILIVKVLVPRWNRQLQAEIDKLRGTR